MIVNKTHLDHYNRQSNLMKLRRCWKVGELICIQRTQRCCAIIVLSLPMDWNVLLLTHLVEIETRKAQLLVPTLSCI